MRYSKVSNVKADTCDQCGKDTGYTGVRYIAVDGSACYCEACFKAKQKAARKAAAASKAFIAAELAKSAEALAPITNFLINRLTSGSF